MSAVHVLHVFATFGRGGPQVRAAQLMARMPADWRHSVLAMDGDLSCRDRVPAEVRWHPLEVPAARGFLATSRAMARLLKGESPDLLLTYNWGAIETVAAARMIGHRALVHHEDGFGPEEAARRLWRRGKARRWLLRRARAVIVPSTGLRQIAETEWGVPGGVLHHLPNGVDIERFRPGRGDGAPDQPLVVGTVGGLRPEKHQALLLEAVAEMQNGCRVTLVGDGPDRSALQELVVQLGLADRVAFRGAIEDPAAEYREMDVFALSSRTEQMPLSVLEAMASGLPVVATRVGDVAEMVAEEGRGLVVEADAAELARALDRLVESPELRRAAGEANRRRCEQEYEIDACLRRYLDVYRQALAEP